MLQVKAIPTKIMLWALFLLWTLSPTIWVLPTQSNLPGLLLPLPELSYLRPWFSVQHPPHPLEIPCPTASPLEFLHSPFQNVFIFAPLVHPPSRIPSYSPLEAIWISIWIPSNHLLPSPLCWMSSAVPGPYTSDVTGKAFPHLSTEKSEQHNLESLIGSVLFAWLYWWLIWCGKKGRKT